VEIYDVSEMWRIISIHIEKNILLLFRYRFGEQHTIYLFSEIIRTILHVQIVVSAVDNSEAPSERKLDENIAKITDQTVRLDLENDF